VSQNTARDQGTLARAGIVAGAFVCVVSFSLFIHTISQLSSPIVSALFIAAGVVLRQRAATPTAHAVALGSLAGGVVAAVATIALAAAGIEGSP
jgi:pyrrolidone-carboxylate peptidase